MGLKSGDVIKWLFLKFDGQAFNSFAENNIYSVV